MYECLPDGLEGGAIDVGHIVIDGMPRRTEAALLARGVIGDDVDAGDLSHRVNGDMIIGNATALALGEETSVTHGLCRTPHLIDDAAGIMERHLFLIELRTLASHHIEEDAVAVLLGIGLWDIGSPVLGTEGPRVAGIVDGTPLGGAPVFGIEADEIDSYSIVYS